MTSDPTLAWDFDMSQLNLSPAANQALMNSYTNTRGPRNKDPFHTVIGTSTHLLDTTSQLLRPEAA